VKGLLLLRKLIKYRELTCANRKMVLEAACFLLVTRLVLFCLPFRKIAGWFGSAGAESRASVSTIHAATARQVGWAVENMSRHTPWQSRCLAQAIAAWWMLARRGIGCTVYFGVAPASTKQLNAHAWLRCGSVIVTGGVGHEKFKVITCFTRCVS